MVTLARTFGVINQRPRLSPREARTILLAIVVITTALSWTFVVQPLRSNLQRDRIALEREQTLWAQERELLANLGYTRSGWQTVLQQLREDSIRFFGWEDSTGGLTSAVTDMEAVVQDAALGADVWLDKITSSSDSTAGSDVLTAATVKITARSSPVAAARFFKALETNERLLRVEQLRILALPNDAARGQMAFEAQIVGFLLSMDSFDVGTTG